MRLIISILIIPFFLLSCQPHSTNEFVGNWNAIELSEEGDSLAVDLKEINFEFLANGRYSFNSTLKYHEAGTFRLDGPFLLSTDTTRNPAKEKAVEIIQMSGDTLMLLMQELDKSRVMVLRKKVD